MVRPHPPRSISVHALCLGLGSVHRSDNRAEPLVGIPVLYITLFLLAAASFAGVGVQVEGSVGVCVF